MGGVGDQKLSEIFNKSVNNLDLSFSFFKPEWNRSPPVTQRGDLWLDLNMASDLDTVGSSNYVTDVICTAPH
jgi:hypothetical protein